MTDSSGSHTTHTAPFLDAVLGANASGRELANGHSAEDEEDYTIKCICDFSDDDGNTVFCETCETWQHIECYYPGKEAFGEHEVHNCADCDRVEHRHLNGGQATQRQKDRRHLLGLPTDRKSRKPPGKSHKKRAKAPELANGWLPDHAAARNGAARTTKDQPPPTKRPKTSHRPSSSMHAAGHAGHHVSHAAKRSISASHTLPSPSKPPSKDGAVRQYSHEFLHLYDDDPGDTPMQANLFNDIAITDSLSLWSHDVEAVIGATNGRTHQDIFMRCEQSVDAMDLPPLRKRTKTDRSVDLHGRHPTWTYLTTDAAIPQNSIVGELRGKIGHMQDYVQEPSNRWEYLRHPLPFVFFHPYLPIYIDTRREGSTCRYLRRSCRPNVSIKTILENGSDYHFCLLTNSELPVATELTVAWTLDEHVRAYCNRLAKGVKLEGSADTDEGYVLDYVGRVLADFGECACDGRDECTMARYDRRKGTPNGDAGLHGARRKGRKSPLHSSRSTAAPTTSRSGSEALRHHDDRDHDHDDSRSTSASAKSKPNSRDMTPSSGIEITDREKRKIAAADKLSQLAQERPASGARKRNRTSGGSTSNTPTAATFVHRLSAGDVPRPPAPHPPAVPKPRYVDTATSHRPSGSPAAKSPLGPSPAAKPAPPASYSPASSPWRRSLYVDSSAQTDPDPDFDDVEMADAPPRKPFLSFTKRMLMKCHHERLRLDEEKRRRAEAAEAAAQMAEHVEDDRSGAAWPDARDAHGDTNMHDAHPSTTPPASESSPAVEKPRPPDPLASPTDDASPPQPSSLRSSSLSQAHPNGHRPSELRVRLPEAKLYTGGPSTPSMAHTPTALAAFSPTLGNHLVLAAANAAGSSPAVSSPIKKKLTLVDYMRRNSHGIVPNNKPDASGLASPAGHSWAKRTTSPTLPASSLRPLPLVAEESKALLADGSSMVETPTIEPPDPMLGVQTSATVPRSEPEVVSGVCRM